MTIKYTELNNIDGSSQITLNGNTSFNGIDNIEVNRGSFNNLSFLNLTGGYANLDILNLDSLLTTKNIGAKNIEADSGKFNNLSFSNMTGTTASIDTLNSMTQLNINGSFNIGLQLIPIIIPTLITGSVNAPIDLGYFLRFNPITGSVSYDHLILTVIGL